MMNNEKYKIAVRSKAMGMDKAPDYKDIFGSEEKKDISSIFSKKGGGLKVLSKSKKFNAPSIKSASKFQMASSKQVISKFESSRISKQSDWSLKAGMLSMPKGIKSKINPADILFAKVNPSKKSTKIPHMIQGNSKNIMDKFNMLSMPKPKKIEARGWSRMREQKGLSPIGDYDKDNVPNILDCEPYNKDKDGFWDKLKNVATGKGWTDSPQEPTVEPYYEEPSKVGFKEPKPTTAYTSTGEADVEFEPVLVRSGKSTMVAKPYELKPLAEEIVSDIEATGKFLAPGVKAVGKGVAAVGKALYKPVAATVGTAAEGVGVLIKKGIEKERKKAEMAEKISKGTPAVISEGKVIVPAVPGIAEIEARRKQGYVSGTEAEARGLIRPGTGSTIPWVKIGAEEAAQTQYGKYLEYGDPGKSQYYKQQYENLLKGYRIARKLPGKAAAFEWGLRVPAEAQQPTPMMGMGGGVGKIATLLGRGGGVGGGFIAMAGGYGRRMGPSSLNKMAMLSGRTTYVDEGEMVAEEPTFAGVPESYTERSISSRSVPSGMQPSTPSPGQGMVYSVRSRKWVRYPRGAYRKTKYLYPAQG